MIYECTFCNKGFKSKREGFQHFKKEQHQWGGLRHIKETASMKLLRKEKKVRRRK